MYLNDWSNKEDVVNSFLDYKPDEKEREDIMSYNILFASYTYQDYSGDAFVLCEKNGILYEVNGSHCSCYGLEGQWSPDKTSYKAIRHRIDNSEYFGVSYRENTFRKELIEFLESRGG